MEIAGPVLIFLAYGVFLYTGFYLMAMGKRKLLQRLGIFVFLASSGIAIAALILAANE